MLQKPWFKTFIWIISTAFFFLASAIIISVYSPSASESQIMQFMSGMMGAMHNSLMGLSMNIEHDIELQNIIKISAQAFVPLILMSIILGIIVRMRRD